MSRKLWLFSLFITLSLTLCLSTPVAASDACSPTSPNPEAATVRVPDVGVPATPASGVADGWVLLYKDPEFKQLTHEVYCKNNKIQFAASPGKKNFRRKPDCTKAACTQAVETGQLTNLGLRSQSGVANHFVWGVHPDVACLTGSGFATLYSFNYGTSFPGYDTFTTGPKLLGDSLGNLYGATPQGGPYSVGSVFKFSCPSTMTVLHAFDYSSSTNKYDGSQPFGSLIFDSAGNLYGTTRAGGTPSSGSANAGMIYELVAPSFSTFNQLYAFNGNSPIGSEPYSGVVFDTAGNLYGSALYGGTKNYGSVYKLSGSTFSTLASFVSNGTGSAAGYYPNESDSLAMDSAGNLFGTNSKGGANGVGTVFEVSPTGVETTLWTFATGANGGGVYPYAAPIIDSSGNLYGTAEYGGANNGGTIWKIPYLGGGQYGTLTVLFSFDNDNNYPEPNGTNPMSGLVMDAAGNLYGTTTCGGSGGEGNACYNYGSGVLFELQPSGTYTVLYNFNTSYGADGSSPVATPLLAADGNLYGTTTNDGLNGAGALWGYALPKSAQTLSVTPGTGSNGSGTITSSPSGINCPGTCSYQFSAGTQVTLTESPATYNSFSGWGGACSGTSTTCVVTMSSNQSVQYTFTSIQQQLYLQVYGSGSGTMTTSTPPNLTCTSGLCGPFEVNEGTQFSVYETPALGSVFSNWGGECSGTGACSVTMDGVGQYKYVAAQFTSVGTSTLTVAETGSGTVTSNPGNIICPGTCSTPFTTGSSVTLTAAPGTGYEFAGWGGACSGFSYTCTVTVSAATNVSAAFAASPAGFAVVYGFSGSTDGGKPMSNLISDGKGNFYGTAYFGGSIGVGAVYMLSPTGSSNCSSAQPTFTGNGVCLVNLYSFKTSAGYYPTGGLVLDSSGNLYGDTYLSNDGYSYVFEINPNSLSNIVFTPLANSSSIGGYLDGGLVIDSSGYLYGIAPNGGPSNDGAVYKIDPTQTPAVQSIVGYSRTFGMGFRDYGPPAMDSAGNFYGTSALTGGNSGYGTIWEVTKSGAFNVLYTFTNTANANDGNALDGSYPSAAPIVDASGNIYGTTYSGGANGGGTIWELSPPYTTLKVLYSFSGGADGEGSYGPLLLDASGNLYGTTEDGGSATGLSGSGVLFELSPNGTYTVLHTFNAATDGAQPYDQVLLANDGNIYGTASISGPNAGSYGGGTVWSFPQPGDVLNVSITGTGTVTSSPAGVNCPGTCYATYNSGTAVTLTATPATNWVFSGWGGACSGSGVCSVTLNALTNVTATFIHQQTTTTTLNSSANPSTYGQSVNFTATVTGNSPTGTVQFVVNSANFGSPVTLSGGSATTSSSSSLSVGTHTVTATYSGDAGNAGSTGTLTGGQVVNQASQTITFTTPPPPSAAYNSSFTVAATGGASGNPVVFTSAGACSNSGATYTMNAGSGTCSVIADQAGNANYSAATEVIVQVNSTNEGASVSVTSSLNPSLYGQSVTFTATIGGAQPQQKTRNVHAKPQDEVITGTVTWSDNTNCGTTTITSGNPGTATCTTSSLAAGAADVVTATYSGDSNHNGGSSGTVSQEVDQASSSTTVTSTPNPSTYATAVTFTATINGEYGMVKGRSGVRQNGAKPMDVTGNVTWSANTGCSPSTVTGYPGVVTCTTSRASHLPVGTDQVTATYSGDSSHSGSSGSVNQVVQGGIGTTIDVASVSPASESYGLDAPVTITAVLTWTGNGVAPTASAVTISGNGFGTYGATTCAPRVHETMTCTATYAPTAADVANSYTETATFAGDSNYNVSNSPETNNFTINQATAVMVVTSNPNPSTYDQSVTFTATINGQYGQIKGRNGRAKPQEVAGTVAWSANTGCGTTTVTPGTPGIATCTTSTLAAGNNETVTATYSGDSNHNGGSGSVSQTVNQASQTITCTQLPPSSALAGSSFPVACTSTSGEPVVIGVSGSCTVSGNTVTMGTKVGTACTMTLNAVGNADYTAAPPLTLPPTTIVRATKPTVSFTGAPTTPVPYQGTFMVTATDSSDPSNVATISAAGVCTISGTTVTMTSGTGKCTLTAKWAAEGIYTTASATQTASASQLTGTISWTTPAATTYGTKLSAAQLDATTNSDGKLVYSLKAGTVLSVGNQTLSVTVAATKNYTAVTTPVTVSLTVNPADTTTTITSAIASTTNPKNVTVNVQVASTLTQSSGKELGTVAVTATGATPCTVTLPASGTGIGHCILKFAAAPSSTTLTATYTSSDTNNNGSFGTLLYPPPTN